MKSKIEFYHGDCFEVLKTIKPKSIDLIITDPPYGVTALEWDKKINIPVWWELIKPLLRSENSLVIIFSQQPFSSQLIANNLKWFRYETIWYKNISSGFLNSGHRPLKSHENILFFSERIKNSTYNPQWGQGKPYTEVSQRSSNHYGNVAKRIVSSSDGRRYPKSVLEYPVDQKQGHSTAKPVGLIEYLVKTYSNPGDTVLDSFLGSGTTAFVCAKTGRDCIGIEMNETYYKKSIERVKTLQEQLNGNY